jgi:SAM-dependent methyltransferase
MAARSGVLHSFSEESQLERAVEIPVCGAKWAAKSEAYAALVAEHLSPRTVWLDAGCGRRLLEDDLEPLEDWLAGQCGRIVGMDYGVTTHRNIRVLVGGSLYAMPFADSSLDLVTCNMVVEHLDEPARAFAEVARCLSPGGAFVINTPNLLNYGMIGNAIASRVMPEEWRLRLVQGTDGRARKDFFPVRYKANTMGGLIRLLKESGFQIHQALALPQQRPFSRRTERLERLLMKLTPISGLLVCAHKRSAA